MATTASVGSYGNTKVDFFIIEQILVFASSTKWLENTGKLLYVIDNSHSDN